MQNRLRHGRSLLVVLLVSALFLFAPPAKAQILEIEQTVFGMDCAPCAYGLEKRLRNLDGVEKARVSLNKGLATVEMEQESHVKLSTIREVIRTSGFSAEAATIRAAGMLKQDGRRWLLELASGERFVLQPTAEGEPAYRQLKPGRVTLTGRVAEDAAETPGIYRLQLLSVDRT